MINFPKLKPFFDKQVCYEIFEKTENLSIILQKSTQTIAGAKDAFVLLHIFSPEEMIKLFDWFLLVNPEEWSEEIDRIRN